MPSKESFFNQKLFHQQAIEWNELECFYINMSRLMYDRHEKEKKRLFSENSSTDITHRHRLEATELGQAKRLAVTLLREQQRQERAVLAIESR